VDWQGQKVPLAASGRRPLLVNLWASWCQPCIQELGAWTKAEQSLAAAGVDVLALATDGLETGEIADAASRSALWEMRFPFRSGRATVQLLQDVEVAQNAVLDRWTRLPLPCSLLLDGQGRLVVIYKGPLDADRLADDVRRMADGTLSQSGAAPLPGRWLSEPAEEDPLALAARLVDFARIADAASYLEATAASAGESDGDTAAPSPGRLASWLSSAGKMRAELGEFPRAIEDLTGGLEKNPADLSAHQALGDVYWQSRKFAECVDQLNEVVRLAPTDALPKRKRGLAQLALGNADAAIEDFQAYLQADPESATVRVDLADACLRKRDAAGAVRWYRESLAKQPNVPKSLNNLAWILATHPDADVRSGSEAVALAERLRDLSGGNAALSLGTLAAAYAEQGRFDEAVKTEQASIAILEARGDAQAVAQSRARLAAYEQGRPFRDPQLAEGE
ncbi:MAG: tetratricopeptide repeat protein, partial [Planctomycetales bacterium]|nr:tetratricopeptide repeat protein [Planctomycetales bacterium]